MNHYSLSQFTESISCVKCFILLLIKIRLLYLAVANDNCYHLAFIELTAGQAEAQTSTKSYPAMMLFPMHFVDHIPGH